MLQLTLCILPLPRIFLVFVKKKNSCISSISNFRTLENVIKVKTRESKGKKGKETGAGTSYRFNKPRKRTRVDSPLLVSSSRAGKRLRIVWTSWWNKFNHFPPQCPTPKRQVRIRPIRLREFTANKLEIRFRDWSARHVNIVPHRLSAWSHLHTTPPFYASTCMYSLYPSISQWILCDPSSRSNLRLKKQSRNNLDSLIALWHLPSVPL